MSRTVGVIHKCHVIVIASWNVLEVDIQGGVRCGNCRVPGRSIKKVLLVSAGGGGGMRQTIRGDKKNSIDG